jgi:PTH1 family peptidyl-tRNA hydrolase
LESIPGLLGKDDFPRLRLGIGRPEPNRDVSGFVLGKFADSETGLLEKVLETAADQLACWVLQGIGQAMNEYNGDYAPTEKKTDDEIRRDDHPEGNRT